MASRGRDLKFNILSDADRFDLSDPARELEDLADAAQDTTKELADLERVDPKLKVGDEAKDAAKDLDKLGDASDQLARDAKETAAKVDIAFEKIASSSKSNLRKVDDDLDRAGEGMGEFKDEASGSAREAAASFSGGFDDIADLVQETAANAFAGFGPMGAAAGIAAAAGIGFLVNSITEAKERAKELAAALIDAKLDDTWDSNTAKVQTFLDSLKDEGDINRFRTAAQKAGIDFNEWVRAMALGGPELERMRDKIALLNDSGGGFERMMTDAGRATTDLQNRTQDQVNAFGEADAAVTTYQDALGNLPAKEEAAQRAAEEHAEAISSLGDAIDGFADPASTYTQLLADKEEAERKTAEKTAAATKNQKDSWEDYVKDVDVSVGEYLSTLEKQVAAQEQWASNLSTLAQRGVEDGVLEQLARMGPEGAPLIAKLTKASDAELAKLVSLYDRQGKAAGDSVAEGILDASPTIKGNASELHREVRDRLSGQVNVPVGIKPPSSGAVWQTRRDIINGLSGITVGVTAIARSIVESRKYVP